MSANYWTAGFEGRVSSDNSQITSWAVAPSFNCKVANRRWISLARSGSTSAAMTIWASGCCSARAKTSEIARASRTRQPASIRSFARECGAEVAKRTTVVTSEFYRSSTSGPGSIESSQSSSFRCSSESTCVNFIPPRPEACAHNTVPVTRTVSWVPGTTKSNSMLAV